MDEGKLGSPKESKFEEDLKKLDKVIDILREMGFKLTVNEDWTTSEMLQDKGAFSGIPLVDDGGQGIRMLYSSYGLRIGFTNAFMESTEPRRVALEDRLRREGLSELID